MINTYNDYLSLVKDIEREHQEEGYCQLHGISLPPERFSLLTATACFAGEKAYNELMEDILFYENIGSIEVPEEDYFNMIEAAEYDYDLAMQEELAWYNHARQLGWE